jgi:hypothetical protein
MSDSRLITETDVDEFREKLDEWSATLNDAERAILQLVLVRAFPESEPDVEGFSTRDASTGQASGKRMHNPFRVIKEYGTASPVLGSSFGGPALGTFVGMSYGPGGVPQL